MCVFPPSLENMLKRDFDVKFFLLFLFQMYFPEGGSTYNIKWS